MPVYNKEKYIKNAIESVISQTFKDWELIIIDDGSVDNSYEICKQFSDERIHVYHTKNQGVSIARNYGMSLARGEYITFIDGDDTVSENYLKHLYIPESEMVIGGLQMVDANGSKIKHRCLTHLILPKRCACADMIGKLCHHKALSHFRGTYEKVSSPLEQTVDKWCLNLKHRIIQRCH